MFCANRFGFGREDIGKLVMAATAAAIVLIFCSVAKAQVPGFTEPFRTVEVASAESGVITRVLVKIGDHVDVDQPVAELDSSIQQAQLDLARHLVSAEAELRRAEAELQTKQAVFEHLQRLSEKGFAQEKELLRAQMELNVAKANSLSTKEHVEENKFRLQLAQISLDRRVIRAAVSGYVSEVHREPGEFISPVNPQVVTVVQVEPILGRFQIHVAEIDRLQIDQTVKVKMESGESLSGKVHSIAMNVESETVAVKVRLPNENQEIRSGQRCYLTLPPRALLSKK